jgi:hypothetical protein
MPRKYPDETVYMKVDGRMQAIGRIYDRDHIGYGTYFITNTKYGRSMNLVGAAPNPDFIELETAVEESRDNLRVAFRNVLQKYLDDPDPYKYDYYAVDEIIQAIRKTFLDKKQKMIDALKK